MRAQRMSRCGLPRTPSYSKNIMKLALLGLGVFPFFASAAVPLYCESSGTVEALFAHLLFTDQCGGANWTGETECVDGG